jgi:hypothetical protein
MPPPKVLVEIGIERHARKASGRGRGSPPHRRCHLHAECLANHLQRRPARSFRAFASHLQWRPARLFRAFWDYQGLIPPPKVLVEIGIMRHGQKSSGRGQGSPPHRGRRLHAERLAHHLQRRTARLFRAFWDYRVLMPPSKVLFEIGIERHGEKASGRGRGSPPHPGRRRHAKRLAHHLQRRPARLFRTCWDY